MSFEAQLLIGSSKPYNVRRFSWSLRQSTDAVGRPDARVQGGQLNVELDSEPDEMLHSWALDDTKKMSGEIIVFSDREHNMPRKTLTFTDAYCVELRKHFDGSSSAQGMTMALILSADQLQVGQVELRNEWPT
ncbi:MAG: hypothetical protein EOO36_02365 [Cytophagaceae bacterium]|nr:MAG: hypothetical protein EOO36_02365 [Cytophagaceae bacterium]